jgi:uncharacterized protein
VVLRGEQVEGPTTYPAAMTSAGGTGGSGSESSAAMVLGEAEIRVLGCLAEKEMTVPETYPMTLNSLVTACNQSTSRYPVMHLSSGEVEAALDSLRSSHQLVRKLFAGAGSRTDKFRHVLEDRLGLTRPEKALVTVLLLRGPQTLSELKTRTERMVDFRDLATVEGVLARLGDPTQLANPDEQSDRRETGMMRGGGGPETTMADGFARPWGGPLVIRMDRQPGQKELRYMHLFGGPIDPHAAMSYEGSHSNRSIVGSSMAAGSSAAGPSAASATRLAERVEQLEAELASLRQEFEAFRTEFS